MEHCWSDGAQSFRPTFMDEFLKLEEHLEDQYASYVKKVKILYCLESELEQYNRQEQERSEVCEALLHSL